MTTDHARESVRTPGLTATLLGTGTSTGVPVVGCGCRVCTSDDPRDRRLRVSVHVEVHAEAGPIHLQIDTGPDFRRQALDSGIRRVDAVLFTHHHFDHVVGMDDLRPLVRQNEPAIPCYASAETASVLRRAFSYIFVDRSYPGVARLELREVDGPFEVVSRAGPAGASVRVTPVPARHGDLEVLGFRIGRFAHLTDVSAVPESSLPLLEGLDLLFLDGLRARPHPTHLSFDDAVAVADRVGARMTYLVHMTHETSHAEAERALPPHVRPGVDGLVVEVEGVRG